MKVKRFEAPTIQEAIKQVKETLGPDAVILSVKEIKKGKGLLGLFTKGVEVTAAIDTPLPSETPILKENREFSKNTSDRMNSPNKLEGDLVDREDFLEINSSPTQADFITQITELNQEVKKLRMFLETFMPQMGGHGKTETDFLDFCNRLKKSGLSQEIALKLLEAFKEGLLDGALNEEISVKDFLLNLIKSLIKVAPPLDKKPVDQQIIAFIGTSGSGKTTTLAKIAARLNNPNQRLCVITIDPRSPEREQLRFYARTLDLPVEIATSPKEISKAVQANADKDFILIDTAGCSPYNEFHIKDLGRYFRNLPKPVAPYLVMDVTAKDEVLVKIANSFEPLGWKYLIFTKLDETEIYGSIFNQMIYTGKALSYFSVGQRVPEDLETATPERVVDLIMKIRGEENGIKRSSQRVS